MVADAQATAGSRPFDHAAVRERDGRDVDRTVNIESAMTNHLVAVSRIEPWRERLPDITVPTLVIHGTEDPPLTPDHGREVATEIPGARFLSLERTGHELPRGVWDVIIAAILARSASTELVA